MPRPDYLPERDAAGIRWKICLWGWWAESNRSRLNLFANRSRRKWIPGRMSRQSGTKAVEKYELPVARVMPITRHGRKPQKRFVVLLKIRLGHLDMVREFSLADRSNFSYQVLLGKNVIAGNAAIDVTRRNTLAREPGS